LEQLGFPSFINQILDNVYWKLRILNYDLSKNYIFIEIEEFVGPVDFPINQNTNSHFYNIKTMSFKGIDTSGIMRSSKGLTYKPQLLRV
jgi:hypothetical protein